MDTVVAMHKHFFCMQLREGGNRLHVVDVAIGVDIRKARRDDVAERIAR